MSSEYVLFSNFELKQLEKTFLTAQLGVLDSLKNLKQYKKVRSQEFSLKIAIKTLLNETQNELGILDKLLPQTSFKPPTPGQEEIIFPFAEEEQRKPSLEEELEKIRKRLSLIK